MTVPAAGPGLADPAAACAGVMLTAGSVLASCEARELPELAPETRLWDRVRLRSASVPGGEWKLVLLFCTRAGLMVTDTWMLMGS